MSKKVFIGSDSADHEIKAKLREFFEKEGIEFVDLGLFATDDQDYDEIVREVGEKVEENDGVGVLVFGKKEKKDDDKGEGAW